MAGARAADGQLPDQLHYLVSAEDYVRFSVFHHEHSKTGKRELWLWRILIPACILLLPIKDGDFGLVANLPLLVFAALCFLLTPKLYRWSLAGKVGKLLKEGPANEFVGKRTLTLMADRLRVEGDGRAQEAAYGCVQRLAVDKGRLYIYIGAISAIIVPFGAFKNEIVRQRFVNLLESKRQGGGG